MIEVPAKLVKYVKQFKNEQEIDAEIDRLTRNMIHLRKLKYSMRLGDKKIALVNYKKILKIEKVYNVINDLEAKRNADKE